MSKIILTRNYKGTTGAKYCAAEWGIPPEHAAEVDGIELTDVRVVNAFADPATSKYESFGCGLVMVGEGTMPAPSAMPKIKDGKEIRWTGFGFEYGDSPTDMDAEEFQGCKKMAATPMGLTVFDE